MPIDLLWEKKEVGEKSLVLVRDVDWLIGDIRTFSHAGVAEAGMARKSVGMSDRGRRVGERASVEGQGRCQRLTGTCCSSNSGLTAADGYMGNGFRETTNMNFLLN